MRFVASALIGRDEETGMLRDVVDAAGRGDGRAVAMLGEAGVGKSRLVREVIGWCADSGIAVAIGRATAGVPTPFRPLTEALLMFDRAHSVRAAGRATEWLRSLSSVVPSWGESVDRNETSAPVIGDAMLRCLSESSERGTVLVLEDLHWADAETLAIVEYLCDNVAGAPLALVVTARPEPASAADVLTATSARGASAIARLSPMPDHQIAQLVRACLDGQVLADVETFVGSHCDGSPLLAEELLAGMHDAGALVRSEHGWVTAPRFAPRVPVTLVDAVHDRLRRCDEATRAVVRAAAVAGRRFEWGIITEATGLGADDTLAALRRAVDAQLLEVRHGAYQFRHALTVDAVRESMSAPELARLAGAMLARFTYPDGAVGTDHTQLAALAEMAGDPDRAATELRAAAREAIERGALESAIAALRRAEQLVVDTGERTGVAIDLASVLVMAGRTIEADSVLAELDRSTGSGLDDRLAVRIQLITARAAVVRGDWRRAEAALAAAADRPPGASAERAELAAVRAHVGLGTGRSEEALRCAEEAVSTGLAAGRADIACEALEVIGRHERFRDPAASTAALTRAVTIADAAEHDGWRLRSLHELAINEAFLEWRIDRLEDVRREACRQGAVLTAAIVDLHEAGVLLIAGERAAAAAIAERCVEACRRYRLGMLPIALLHVASAEALAGREEPALTACSEALSLAPDDLDIRSQVEGWVSGGLALAVGDLGRWHEHLTRAMEIVGTSPDTIPSPWRGQWALASAVAGDREPVEQVRASHAGVVGLNRASLALADAVCAGRRGDVEGARAFVSEADAIFEREPCGLPRHLGRLLIASDALAGGWCDVPRDLRAAHGWFSDAGYPQLAATTRSTMRALGVPAPRRGRGTSDVPAKLRELGVTSREMDVLHLLSAGDANRDIAAQLHLSVRTVEKYVGSLLLKTGTQNRRDLVDFAGAGTIGPSPEPARVASRA